MIPYGRQDIRQEDIDAVVSVLRSDLITQGPLVPRFESLVANYCGVRYSVAVNSATSALHISCLALGLGPGDWLWTSPITFVASANCARFCGANVDFVDIDPVTYNMSPRALEEKLIRAKNEGRLPKIVVPVHFSGQSCEMEVMHLLSRKYGFRIVEDASHAIGAKYHGDSVGKSRYSDITVFSFHPVKIITTGEGGMALTNDAKLAERMTVLRSHGITRDPALMTNEAEGAWYYQQQYLGFNYRMTDIQAALGVSQLSRLEEYVTRRHEIAQLYTSGLSDLPLTTPWQNPNGRSAMHLYVIRIQEKRSKLTRLEIFNSLRSSGIGVNVHYIPIHTQPYYKSMGFTSGDFPHAEAYYQQAISLPIYPTLTLDEQAHVIESIRDAFQPCV
jgi:UDP-4-amino-4,6-dideoxy-N-acetyl-beta-L-altrosamine transaminase